MTRKHCKKQETDAGLVGRMYPSAERLPPCTAPKALRQFPNTENRTL